MAAKPSPGTCSECGSAMVPIAYGFPGGEMMEAAERGEIVLGGCVVWDDMPLARCPECQGESS